MRLSLLGGSLEERRLHRQRFVLALLYPRGEEFHDDLSAIEINCPDELFIDFR